MCIRDSSGNVSLFLLVTTETLQYCPRLLHHCLNDNYFCQLNTLSFPLWGRYCTYKGVDWITLDFAGMTSTLHSFELQKSLVFFSEPFGLFCL